MTTTLVSPIAPKRLLNAEWKFMYNVELRQNCSLTILNTVTEPTLPRSRTAARLFEARVIDRKTAREIGAVAEVDRELEQTERAMSSWPAVPVFVTTSVVIDQAIRDRFRTLCISGSHMLKKTFLVRDLHSATDKLFDSAKTN